MESNLKRPQIRFLKSKEKLFISQNYGSHKLQWSYPNMTYCKVLLSAIVFYCCFGKISTNPLRSMVHSCRSHSINLHCKQMDCFLYEWNIVHQIIIFSSWSWLPQSQNWAYPLAQCIFTIMIFNQSIIARLNI